MESDRVLEVVEEILRSRPLNPTEQFVLRQSWYGKTYDEMAQDCGYGSVYIKEIGSRLWHDLSEVVGRRVTKKNLHIVISDYQQHYAERQKILLDQNSPIAGQIATAREDLVANYKYLTAIAEIEPPGAPLPLNSALYINRPPVEELIYSGISQPGCVILVKASRKMGKSSLLNRVNAYAKTQKYKTVCIDLREADEGVFASLNKFLRWFCVNVSRQLNLSPKIDDYWDEEMGSKVSCKLYFEEYLLEQIHSPLLLAVNAVDRVFEYPIIANDFLSMLRFWHEQAKQVEIWQQLRLILVHTTEIYIPLKLNQSPFNVGMSIQLPPFTLEQVQELARRYGIEWANNKEGLQCLAPLIEMLGGHPYLVNVALYHLCRQEVTLEELLRSAPTQAGIYGNHLQSLLALLRDRSELASALQQVVTAKGSVQLETITGYKLESLGLVQLEANQAQPSCELYRLYFRQHLAERGQGDRPVQPQSEQTTNLPVSALGEISAAQVFQSSTNIHTKSLDRFPEFATWQDLNKYLQTNWQQWTREMSVLSLIVGDVDYFKFYHDARGQLAGDDCMRRIANTIHECVKYQAILTGWYGETKFAALLPHTNATVASEIAEIIRRQVKALGIAHEQSKIEGFPSQFVTVSIGVASTASNLQSAPETLMTTAVDALSHSKRKGRDRVTVLSV